MKTKFLISEPNKEATSMVIENIWLKNTDAGVSLAEDDHLIEIMLSELIAMDIRKGDVVNFVGDECVGVDLSQRPQDAVPFAPCNNELPASQKAKIKGAQKKAKK